MLKRLVPICVVAIAMATSATCVKSGSSSCGDIICPDGTSCVNGSACFPSDLVAACEGKAEGGACSVAGYPPNVCKSGVCQASRCGDGRVTGSEQCDGSLLQGQTCQSVGYYGTSGLACGADCKFDTSACGGHCGDGVKNGPEQCDGTDMGGATCFDVGFYKPNTLRCNSKCQFDKSQCTGGYCGDGIINGLEECDGEAMGSATCATLGYHGSLSVLSCSRACTYSSSSCLCTQGHCTPNTQQCVCGKTGCGCTRFP